MSKYATNYMEDCIHLRACRRLQKIFEGKFYGARVSRQCNEDCTAYQDYCDVVHDEMPAELASVYPYLELCKS